MFADFPAMVPHDVFVGEFSTNSELDSEVHTSVESDFALVFRSDAHIELNNRIDLHVQNKRMANHRKCICLLGGVGHQGRRTESKRKGVSAQSDTLVCESPKRWRISFAHGRLTPDGLQHRGMSSTNRGKRTPNHCLMLKNLKLSTPWSTEAHAI